MKIIGMLKQAESAMKVTELCRQHGISDVTFYNWRSQCKKWMTHLRLVRAAPTGVNERWSTDLVTDGLFNGRRFRALTIVPEFAGRALDAWAHHQGVRHQLIVPGKPVQNAFRVLTDSCEKNA